MINKELRPLKCRGAPAKSIKKKQERALEGEAKEINK